MQHSSQRAMARLGVMVPRLSARPISATRRSINFSRALTVRSEARVHSMSGCGGGTCFIAERSHTRELQWLRQPEELKQNGGPGRKLEAQAKIGLECPSWFRYSLLAHCFLCNWGRLAGRPFAFGGQVVRSLRTPNRFDKTELTHLSFHAGLRYRASLHSD